MHHFQYRSDRLMCEEVPIERIAEEIGTPFYLYSHATLTHHFWVFDQAFADFGGGADVVSGGELYRVLRAGIPPSRIVFAGVGKTREEMGFALKPDILMFNVEFPQELRLLNDVAGAMGTKARVALRINPDVDPNTYPYIATGSVPVSTAHSIPSYPRDVRSRER